MHPVTVREIDGTRVKIEPIGAIVTASALS
jgi:hypothetical protein